MRNDQLIMNGLYLFKSLIKDGCEWRGDVCSKKWSERVFIPAGLEHQVELTLGAFEDGVEYSREGNWIWIV